MDIELVNQELNFHSPDNNLIIKGGCDLFTTKPISTDKKLFKTIDKHLDQMLEDHQLSRSIERKQSVNSLFGSSASPPRPNFALRRGSHISITERERRPSNSLFSFNKTSDYVSQSPGPGSYLSLSLLEEHMEDTSAIEESPFGPLKNISTRKTFAYLIAILNTTYPDHDFSNLQPTTENFHKVESPEVLMNQFNNIMVSLGKKEDLLSWIWDTVNVYMDVFPSRSPSLPAQGGSGSRKSSFSNGAMAMSPKNDSYLSFDPGCKIYEFRPSDQSILEDLNHPYQTLWSYYWFIYNKKKKRVCFLYLTGLNRLHYSQVNENTDRLDDNDKLGDQLRKNDNDSDDYMDEDADGDDSDDVLGDIEI